MTVRSTEKLQPALKLRLGTKAVICAVLLIAVNTGGRGGLLVGGHGAAGCRDPKHRRQRPRRGERNRRRCGRYPQRSARRGREAKPRAGCLHRRRRCQAKACI